MRFNVIAPAAVSAVDLRAVIDGGREVDGAEPMSERTLRAVAHAPGGSRK